MSHFFFEKLEVSTDFSKEHKIKSKKVFSLLVFFVTLKKKKRKKKYQRNVVQMKFQGFSEVDFKRSPHDYSTSAKSFWFSFKTAKLSQPETVHTKFTKTNEATSKTFMIVELVDW